MMRLLKSLLLLLSLLSSAVVAQDKPATPPKPTPEVQKLLTEGVEFRKKSDWTATIASFEKALQLAQQTSDVPGQATAISSLGSTYSRIAQPQKALEYHQQALPLYQQCGHKVGEAGTLINIGLVYQTMRQVQKAYDYYQQALLLEQQIGNKIGEARAFVNLGFVLRAMNQPQKALSYYQQALALYQQLGDKAEQANLLIDTGNAYHELGKSQKVLEHYQQALALVKETGNKRQEASTLLNTGIIYRRIGQMQRSLDYCRQALALFQQIGEKRSEANAFLHIGNVYGQREQMQEASKNFRQALLLYKQLGDTQGQAQALGNLGNLFQLKGQAKEALNYCRQSLPLFRQIGDPSGEALVLLGMGNVYSDSGDQQKALEHFQQALVLFRQQGDKYNEALLMNNIGEAWSRQKQPNPALAALRQSLALYEQMRTEIGGSAENRQEYLASVLDTYGRLCQLQLHQKQTADAFATVNQMKARSLLEQIGDKPSLSGIPIEAQTKLAALRSEYDKISLQAATEDKDSAQGKVLRTRLAESERRLAAETDRLFALYPGTAQKNAARTATLSDIPRFLSADTALLEFITLRFDKRSKGKTEQIVLLVATIERGKPVLTAHTLALKVPPLRAKAEKLRRACASPQSKNKPLGRELASYLFPRAVMKRLAGKKRLVISPDGIIWNVPFAALLLPDGKYLIERFEIDYAYSATGVQAFSSIPHKKLQGELLVLANPDFGDSSRFGKTLPDQIAKGIERPLSDPARPLSDPARPLFEPARLAGIIERGKIKSLPGTKVEAEALAKLYPNAQVMTGKQAQEAELVKSLPKYRYLHFATHGLFSDVAPLQSAIVLAVPPKDSPDDGFLTAREIYDMTLHAEMAVLSACETARGVNKDGEGMIGLTWALFAAGVSTQVVSQWKISDNSTPELMRHFYGNLKNGQKDSKGQMKPMGKGEALQKAAIAMMKDGKHSHPYHWASFVLFGDWR